MRLGFVQKQAPDRRRISNKTTLTLTLPSDGRGNRQPRLSQLPERFDTPTDGGRFSLSHPMGEGRGEGECAPKSVIVFARVLSPSVPTGGPSRLRRVRPEKTMPDLPHQTTS